ncbi:MAG TPA: Gfo/Idh/MocA family oxidoreductase [Anaeromyxobacteraceae bacterium]|nr:Gfo/Idh/MocA family oxidoreductase [Anaeromyxobacteraceae bacterium]
MTASSTPKRLRGALIGYGFIGERGHVPAYLKRSDVAIAAVADVCAARRALIAQKLPAARVYDSAEALFQAEKGQLDFVDIATPPVDHAPIGHRALDLGLHVLCEKPLTTRLPDALALLEHARRARRVIYPCHNYKHAPVVVAIRDILRSGRLGKIRSVTLATYRNTHAKGVTEWNTHWRRLVRHSGGGIAMDHGSHTFYLTFEWMGALPTAVTAKVANSDPKNWDTEDNFSAVLTFPGGLADVHLTWTAGVRKVIYTLQGERGAITIDDDELQLATQRATGGPDVAQGAVTWDVERRTIASDWMDASHTHWFNAMFDQFRAALASGDFAGREAMDACRCVEIITTAYRSAAEGCRELPLGLSSAPRPAEP